MFYNPASALLEALNAQVAAAKARADHLATLTPFEREHLRQVSEHERQYRKKNAPVTHVHRHAAGSAHSADNGEALMAGAIGFGLGAMLD